jgi:hypothetical protein
MQACARAYTHTHTQTHTHTHTHTQVRVNTNLKAKTVEEILGERGQMFQTALTYHERHLESELTLVLKGETTSSMPGVRAGDVKKKLENKPKGDTGAIDEIIKKKFKDETKVLRGRSAEWFNDDNHYRAAIDEALDLKSAALQTFEYYVRTESTSAKVMNMDLRKAANAYRKHLEQLMRENSGAARKDLALQLLKCEGFAFAPDGAAEPDQRGKGGPGDTCERERERERSSLKHLCQCAAEGNRLHIELLLEAGLFDVNDVDKMGSSALMTAAEFGHLGSIELLIQKNADVDKVRESDQVTAVYLAAKGGHTACVRMLHGGSRKKTLISTKSQTGAKGHNALTVTASNGSAACMQVLCKGNDAALTQDELDSPGLAGLPALCWALKTYHLECIDVMIGTNSQKCTAQGIYAVVYQGTDS